MASINVTPTSAAYSSSANTGILSISVENADWHEQPQDGDIWMAVRRRINGVWGSWAVLKVKGEDGEPGANGRDGQNGLDGTSPVIADLDNESVGIGLDSSGKTTAAYVLSTNVWMSYGTTRMPLSSITVGSVNGITVTKNTSTGLITFSIASGVSLAETTSIPITLVASYGGVSYSRSLVYTIAGIKGGADGTSVNIKGEKNSYSELPSTGSEGDAWLIDGDLWVYNPEATPKPWSNAGNIQGPAGKDGVVYFLTPTVSSIKKSANGTMSVSTIACSAYKSVGESGISSASECTMKYALDGGSENAYTSGTQINVSSFSNKIEFILYYGNLEIARSTIFIEQDGVGIQSTEIRYAVGGAGGAQPADSAFTYTSVPSSIPGTYIWCRMRIYYTNGTSSTTYTPSRVGADGESPMVCNRGEYKSDKLYYGSSDRIDVVYYAGQYWHTSPTAPANPFSGIAPGTNSNYWLSFGASYENVATGFLFAEEAVIEKGVVRKLRTSDDETAKRIIINDNVLTMFDGTDVRLSISGDELASVPSSSAPSMSSATVLNRTESFPDVSSGWVREGQSSGDTITINDSGNHVSVGSLNVTFFLDAEIYSGSCDAICVAGFLIDGVKVNAVSGYIQLDENDSSGTLTLTIPEFNSVLAVGNHTVQVYCTIRMSGDAESSGTLNYSAYAYGSTIHIDYTSQSVQIRSNGFRAMFGSNYMFECSKTGSANSSIKFFIRAGNYGLMVDSTGVYKMTNGSDWVSL